MWKKQVKRIKANQNLRKHNDEAAKWKQKVKNELMRGQKRWDDQYINNIYNNSSSTILDFFFKKSNKEQEVLIMRQRKTDLKTDMFSSIEEAQKMYNSVYKNGNSNNL